MTLEGRAGNGRIDTVVDAAAFGAGEGEARNQRRNRIGGRGEVGQAVGISDHAGLEPDLLTQLRRRHSLRRHRHRSREPAREARLVESGKSRPPPENEALQKRVRRQAIRPVHSRCGALPRRVEAVDRRPPYEIRHQAADRVVGRR